MTALRLSAILSILVAAFYALGLINPIRYGVPIGGTIWLMLVGIIVPLVPGLLALFGRATFLLPAVWGWILGARLPKLLVSRPQLPMDLIHQSLKSGDRIFIVGPDYLGMALVAVAIVGLALCGFSYYREQHSLSS